MGIDSGLRNVRSSCGLWCSAKGLTTSSVLILQQPQVQQEVLVRIEVY